VDFAIVRIELAYAGALRCAAERGAEGVARRPYPPDFSLFHFFLY
jgi:hypothetical protein